MYYHSQHAIGEAHQMCLSCTFNSECCGNKELAEEPQADRTVRSSSCVWALCAYTRGVHILEGAEGGLRVCVHLYTP
jgi:hypothetical protein